MVKCFGQPPDPRSPSCQRLPIISNLIGRFGDLIAVHPLAINAKKTKSPACFKVIGVETQHLAQVGSLLLVQSSLRAPCCQFQMARKVVSMALPNLLVLSESFVVLQELRQLDGPQPLVLELDVALMPSGRSLIGSLLAGPFQQSIAFSGKSVDFVLQSLLYKLFGFLLLFCLGSGGCLGTRDANGQDA